MSSSLLHKMCHTSIRPCPGSVNVGVSSKPLHHGMVEAIIHCMGKVPLEFLNLNIKEILEGFGCMFKKKKTKQKFFKTCS